MSLESRLEELLKADPSILGLPVLLIGRHVSTAHGKFVDLLGIDAEGTRRILQLKRDLTPGTSWHRFWITIEYISDAAQRQRIGQLEGAQQSAEYNDVLRQEADLTGGHVILRTTGLISVSAQDPDELERVVADIEQAAIQASCETRRLWGQQSRSRWQPGHCAVRCDRAGPSRYLLAQIVGCRQ